jgi:hypothetical protein
MLRWTFFATGLSEASNSVVNNANLISTVYFPRLIVPTATVVVDFDRASDRRLRAFCRILAKMNQFGNCIYRAALAYS